MRDHEGPDQLDAADGIPDRLSSRPPPDPRRAGQHGDADDRADPQVWLGQRGGRRGQHARGASLSWRPFMSMPVWAMRSPHRVAARAVPN